MENRYNDIKNSILDSISVLVAYIYVAVLLLAMLLKDHQLDNNDLFLAMISVGAVIVDKIGHRKEIMSQVANPKTLNKFKELITEGKNFLIKEQNYEKAAVVRDIEHIINEDGEKLSHNSISKMSDILGFVLRKRKRKCLI